jgi:hypothetical protein
MKLGIIHSKGRFFLKNYLDKYALAGIGSDFSSNLEEFLSEHQPMRFAYDGFLIHPPLDQFNSWMREFRDNVPQGSRFALLTYDIGGSLVVEEGGDDLSVFDVNDVEGIKKYFEKKDK